MIIDCISDLHGYKPKLNGGDLLIIPGDLTARDEVEEYIELFKWLSNQHYKKIIFIGGNHDFCLLKIDKLKEIFSHKDFPTTRYSESIEYLCDSGTEFEGIKIWGTPHSLNFDNLNPKCSAFTGDEEYLNDKYDLIPNDIDILISHGPPHGILDKNKFGINCGSILLRNLVLSKQRFPNLKAVIFGHIHEMGNKIIQSIDTVFINCSLVNEYYKPINSPFRIELMYVNNNLKFKHLS